MDDKTDELRELFVSTTGEETVTESQSDPRGSLSSADDATVDERLTELIEAMRERYTFASSLSTTDLRRVVRGFFDSETVGVDPESWSRDADAALAESLDVEADAAAVFRARMDLHLVADADRDAPFPYERLRGIVARAREEDDSALDDADLAASLAASDDVDAEPDPEAVRRYRRVAEADLASRRASHRFRDAFGELLTDAELSTRLAEDAREDGLEEATEDIETDVSF